MQLTPSTPWLRDSRGSTIIQFVLVLPIFIILVFGSYEIWKLVHLKRSLEAATVQAARYLSIEGSHLDKYPEDWEAYAWTIVAQELENEPLLQDELSGAELWIEVDTRFRFGEPRCPGEDSKSAREAVNRAERAQFSVYSELRIPSPIRIPLVGTAGNLTLTERHWRYRECGPNTLPTPSLP